MEETIMYLMNKDRRNYLQIIGITEGQNKKIG